MADGAAGPQGGRLEFTTVKAKVALVGVEYVGDDGIQRILGRPLGLYVRHFRGMKHRVDLIVGNLLRPDSAAARDWAANGVRGLFVFRELGRPVPEDIAAVGRHMPVVVGLDAEKGLELLANLILDQAVGVRSATPEGVDLS